MKKNQTLIYRKCYTSIVGTTWVAGLLIAGSESPYMPWINGIGLILFFCASIMLGKLFQTFDSKDDVMISSKFNKTIKSNILDSKYSKIFIFKKPVFLRRA